MHEGDRLILRAITVLAVVVAGVNLGATLLVVGLSGMCSDDFDVSDCAYWLGVGSEKRVSATVWTLPLAYAPVVVLILVAAALLRRAWRRSSPWPAVGAVGVLLSTWLLWFLLLGGV